MKHTNKKEKPYLYNSGLKRLAKEAKGDERIHMGIRPFGFHAGNLVSLYISPYLFFEEVKRLGKPVNFTLFYSINDYEQDELDGPDHIRYPFNVFPKNTTLGYAKDPESCHEYVIDHWEPIIKKCILTLRDHFTGLQIYFVRNSELKGDIKFKEILTSTLRNPTEQADIYRRFTDKEILEKPIQYAGVVCPVCKRTKGTTHAHRVNGDYIHWKCGTCGISFNASYASYDYWFYHKPLFTARLSIFNIDITFSGNDHFSEGDFLVRQEFIKRFNPDLKIPKMYFGPLILAEDGEKMSKSRKNVRFGDVEALMKHCKDKEVRKLQIVDKFIAHPTSDEEYIDFF